MIWIKQNKYGNKKTVVDGIVFDSRKEASRWQELRLLEKTGEITALKRQLRIEIIPKTKLYRARYYVADFVYYDNKERKTVYEDVKGVRTDVYKLKKAILYWRYGIDIKET